MAVSSETTSKAVGYFGAVGPTGSAVGPAAAKWAQAQQWEQEGQGSVDRDVAWKAYTE